MVSGPPVLISEPGKQDPNSEKAVRGQQLNRKLHHELKEAGCLKASGWQIAPFMVGISVLYLCTYGMLLSSPHWSLRAALLIFSAFLSVQSGFVAHELLHGAVTRNRKLSSILGQIFDSTFAGLSYAHFCSIHYRHHLDCNDESRDPDVQSGIFSIYPAATTTKRGLGRYITNHQHYLIWILVTLQGFSIKFDGVMTVWRLGKRARLDRIFLGMHGVIWFGIPLFIIGPIDTIINYGIMTWFIGPYLGSVFLVNHIGTQTIESQEPTSHFFQQVETTRNIGGSRLCNFYFGGVNNHIEHHLFPNIPAQKLPLARVITREFCSRHGVPYREMSWWHGVTEVFHYFRDIAAKSRSEVLPSTPKRA